MSRIALATLLVLAALLAAAAPASAADAHAPRGARLDWLPTSEWVMSSWLPYDEARLYALAGTSRAELSTWLNDRRTIGELARQHGRTDLHALAHDLVAPREHGLSTARRRVLEQRAL